MGGIRIRDSRVGEVGFCEEVVIFEDVRGE